LDYSPNFSPDGKSVVFTGSIMMPNENADWGIFTVNIDGTNLKQLTNKNSSYSWPHYSTDAATIIFSNNTNGHTKLYTMDTDGNNTVQITGDGEWWDWDGTFSPDGKEIVFVSDRSGNDDIWVMPVSNPSAAINLTNNPAIDISPDWSPDGSMIVFASDRDKTGGSSFDIFTMDSDGGHHKNITPDLKYSDEGKPSW
jgi:TolB protein